MQNKTTHKDGNALIQDLLLSLKHLNQAISQAPNEALNDAFITPEIESIIGRIVNVTNLATDRLHEPYGSRLVPTWSDDVLGRDVPNPHTLSRQLLIQKAEQHKAWFGTDNP